MLLLLALLAPPELLVAGCAQQLADGRCLVEAGATLTTWAPTPPLIRWGPLWLPANQTATAMGWRARVVVPVSPATLAVDGAPLTIGRPLRCPVVEQTRTQQAKAQLATLDRAPPAADPRCAALRAGRRARALLRTGQSAAALDALEASARAAHAAGLRSAWRDDTLAAVFVATWRTHELDRARRLLAEWGAVRSGEGAFRLPYYRAQIATEAGDLRTALADLDASAVQAQRFGDARGLAQARHGLAVALRRVGRFAAADRILGEVVDAAGADRMRALVQRANNRLHWRAVDPQAPDPWPAFDAARAAVAAAEDAQALGSLTLSAARSAWLGGAPQRAKALLAETPPSPRLERWRALIEAEIAAAQEAPAADAALAAVIAAERPTSELAWLAWVARARLAGRTAPARALAHYARAERVARAQRALVPVGSGRGAIGAARRSGWAGQIAAHVAADQPREALTVLRRAVTGWLADLGGQHDPALARAYADAIGTVERLTRARRTAVGADLARIDAALAVARSEAEALVERALGAAPPRPLPPPSAGRLFVGFAQIDGAIWRLWATAEAAGADALSADALAAEAFTGLDAPLAAARSVWLFVDPALDALDLHGAQWRGRPLTLQRPVIYGLDLAGGAARAAGDTVVVRDPRGDLAAARGLRWPGATVLHQGAARRARVLPALATARRLIYAGHSVAAGIDGWQSALLLAGRDRLAISDLLVARRAPAEVILAGCQSGGVAAGVTAAGMVQAFLAAGSQRGVGTTRVVADGLAAAITDALADRAAVDLVEAWPAALAAVAAARPAGDWRAFRFWARVSDSAAPPGQEK